MIYREIITEDSQQSEPISTRLQDISYIIIYERSGDNKNQKQDIKVRYCGDRQHRIKKTRKFWCTVPQECIQDMTSAQGTRNKTG